MMHTEIYCSHLENLDRVEAIRAIQQALIQLQATADEVVGFDNNPAIEALSDCLKAAGHVGFTE